MRRGRAGCCLAARGRAEGQRAAMPPVEHALHDPLPPQHATHDPSPLAGAAAAIRPGRPAPSRSGPAGTFIPRSLPAILRETTECL